jgi:hypothetical protein
MSDIVIADALAALNIEEYIIYGKPTNEAEFNAMFCKVTGADDNGTAIESSDPADFGVTWAEVSAKLTELQAEYDAAQYARDRVAEYPSIGDQLDALFHAGVFPDDMAATIQAVKDKYPKGGS